MFDIVRADLKRYYNIEGAGTPLSFRTRLYIMIFSYGLHATLIYRIGTLLEESLKGPLVMPFKYLGLLFCSCINFLIRVLYGITIDRRARIGKGLYIGHFGGIVVGECCLGSNCSIHQQVQIGRPGSLCFEEGPRIGDSVWIGGHSKIVGPITIGDNVTIAAGSVVKTNIMNGSLVAGNPARVISRRYDNLFLLSGKNGASG